MKVGDRVRLTEHAKERYIDSRSPMDGTITRISKCGTYVYVRKDGNKTACSYHKSFWEKIKRNAFYTETTNDTFNFCGEKK